MPKKSISIRAKEKDGITQVRTIIAHPMEMGRRSKSNKTREKIVAHFIQEVNCEHNGKRVLMAEWGIAMSKNPYFSFKFKGGKKGDTIKISWADNKGQRDSSETQIQ